MVLLSVEFVKLVTIAIVIAWPISYLLIDEWLNYFAYQMNIDLLSFIVGALAAFALAMLITNTRAFITAKANPVNTLKYE
jgi:putative ABC transport system permease protein